MERNLGISREDPNGILPGTPHHLLVFMILPVTITTREASSAMAASYLPRSARPPMPARMDALDAARPSRQNCRIIWGTHTSRLVTMGVLHGLAWTACVGIRAVSSLLQ